MMTCHHWRKYTFRLFILNIPRPTGTRGGCSAALFKTQFQLRVRTNPCNTTYFESTCITDSVGRLNLVVIYRPPQSPANGFKISDFLTEFDSYMDEIVLLPGKLLLVGDFNVHWNKPEKLDVKEYANTLSSANLQQHIDTATHVSGNILDHVICSCDENFVQDCKVYENLTTVPRTVHHFVHFKVNLQKPLPLCVTKTLRNFKNIQSAAFSQTLTDHLNLAPETRNADELYNWYNETITNCLEEHAPS